ncbi:hypothetical protein J5N97_022901 [Dioscorea zingiberensis]|uniref:t-SNARE coiled-coil homology domain-containing protein n=1 Tax=Dioscorea zingiberensis TaxID=325984 RepID=A0A9D5HB26_9LILI|nr:hypothetical protein J5N97_022901 [Dioscorea zingiberensis]
METQLNRPVTRAEVMDTLKEIQERHDTVKEIEKKLLHLHQVFMDMAVLVEAQGEMLDNIETQKMHVDCCSHPADNRHCHCTINPQTMEGEVEKLMEKVSKQLQKLQKLFEKVAAETGLVNGR